jgi:hypothetical protein
MKLRMAVDGREFVHRVDAQNRIILTNQDWRDFAVENRVAHLSGDAIQGVSLWKFIHGMETRFIFEVMLAKVRRGGGPVTLPFRCDSPDRRRYMEQTLSHAGSGTVEFTSRVPREEIREVPRLLDEGVPRSEELVHCCGWCKKMLMPDERWVEVEEAVSGLDLFAEPAVPQITHGACPACVQKINGIAR